MVGTILWIALSAGLCVSLQRFACFNTVLDLTCPDRDVIVFDTVRYGRNDTDVALRCDVPFSRYCDIDVHFHLNRICAGKRTCSVPVTSAIFADPCGYEEFLKVSYKCIPESSIDGTCPGPYDPPVSLPGFLSSPNYPDKYYMSTDCLRRLNVQRWQSIRLILYDFELDVRRAAHCLDVLKVTTSDGVEYFNDCGVLGKQTIEVNATEATVRFTTGQSSLPQRGYLIYFEAVGVGCVQYKAPLNARTIYYIENGVLTTNTTCLKGYQAPRPPHGALQQSRCSSGLSWDSHNLDCIALASQWSTSSVSIPRRQLPHDLASSSAQTTTQSGLALPTTTIGVSLGAVSAILMLASTVALAVNCYLRKCRQRLTPVGNKSPVFQKWEMVVNNLHGQEKLCDFNEELRPMSSHFYNKVSSGQKTRNKDHRLDDFWQTRKLLEASRSTIPNELTRKTNRNTQNPISIASRLPPFSSASTQRKSMRYAHYPMTSPAEWMTSSNLDNGVCFCSMQSEDTTFRNDFVNANTRREDDLECRPVCDRVVSEMYRTGDSCCGTLSAPTSRNVTKRCYSIRHCSSNGPHCSVSAPDLLMVDSAVELSVKDLVDGGCFVHFCQNDHKCHLYCGHSIGDEKECHVTVGNTRPDGGPDRHKSSSSDRVTTWVVV